MPAYLVLKVAWTADVPLGISDRSVLHGSGWVASNALMAVIQLAGLLLVLALTRPWARRVPVWLLLFPVWVGTGLLADVAVGATLSGLFPSMSQDSSSRNADLGGMSLYWAADGSFGLVGSQSDPPRAVQAARVAGAAAACLGLLGLAGRWGQRTRFWLPAALTWIGSGAVAAFDGFRLALNKLVLLGADASEPGWTVTDTLVAFMVVIGVLAAAVGAVAIAAAAKDNQVGPSREAHQGSPTRCDSLLRL